MVRNVLNPPRRAVMADPPPAHISAFRTVYSSTRRRTFSSRIPSTIAFARSQRRTVLLTLWLGPAHVATPATLGQPPALYSILHLACLSTSLETSSSRIRKIL